MSEKLNTLQKKINIKFKSINYLTLKKPSFLIRLKTKKLSENSVDEISASLVMVSGWL